MIPILVTDVMEVVSLVPEEMQMTVINHALKAFTITKEHVSMNAQKVTMKMMQQSKLVNHAT